MAQGPVDLRLEVATGEPATTGDDSVLFQRIGDVDFNDHGQVVFAASFGPEQPTGLPREPPGGVFLRSGLETRNILIEGDPLPGGGTAGFDPFLSKSPFVDINNRGNISILIPELGILLYQQGTLNWLVRNGDIAPGTSSTFAQFDSPPFDRNRRVFNDQNQMAFIATLADGRKGIFLISPGASQRVVVEGEPIPALAGMVFDSQAISGAALVLLEIGLGVRIPPNSSPGALLFFSGGTLSPVLAEGTTPSDLENAHDRILSFTFNEQGQFAVVFHLPSSQPAAAFGRPGELRKIFDSATAFPGFVGRPTHFEFTSLDNQSRFLFLARDNENHAALYFWKEDTLQKLVADGDPTPVGGAFLLGRIPEVSIIGPIRSFQVTPMTDGSHFAFEATVEGTDLGQLWFIWAGGAVMPIPTSEVGRTVLPERLISNVTLAGINEQGQVLLETRLCCTGPEQAVFTTAKAAAQTQFLPFFAVGASEGLSYGTQIEVANHSTFTGTVRIRAFRRDGQILVDTTMTLLGGQTEMLGLSTANFPQLTSGYIQAEVEGGATISLHGLLQLSNASGLKSQTSIVGSAALVQAGLIVEVDEKANSGVAVSNPGEENNRIMVALVDHNSSVLSTQDVVIPAGMQSSLFVNELFSAVTPPFLGRLVLTAERPFLLAGLRLAHLQLSTLPVDSAFPKLETRGFRNILTLQQAPFEAGLDLIQDVLDGPDDRIAIHTRSGRIVLLERGQVFEVLNHRTILPGVERTIPREQPGVRLIGFSGGSLYFRTRIDGTFGEGVFCWKDAKLEKILLAGESFPDGSRFGGGVEISRNHQLLFIGLSVSSHTFFVFDGERFEPSFEGGRIFDLRDVAFGTQLIALLTPQELVLLSENGETSVARLGDVIDGRFEITRFGRIELTPGDRILFTAYGKQFVSPGERESGLFLYDGTATRVLAIIGDPVPGRPDAVFGPLEHSDFSNPRSTFQVNAGGQIAVLSSLTAADGQSFLGQRGAFILFHEEGGARLIVPDPDLFPNDAPFTNLPSFQAFHWNDRDQLLFEANPRLGTSGFSSGLYLWESGGITPILREGDRLSQVSEPFLTLASRISRAWLQTETESLFFTFVAGKGGHGLYAGRRGHFEQRFIPHLVSGDFSVARYQTSLFLHNAGSSQASVGIELYRPEGTILENGDTVLLQPGEVRRIDLDLPEAFVGWSQLNVQGAPVRAFERFSVLQQGELISEVTIPSVERNDRAFWVGSVRPRFEINGGLAIANPYHVELEVFVETLRAGLEVGRQVTVTIPPKGHRSFLFSELFPSISEFRHLFRIRPFLPAPAISLRLDGVRITSVPLLY